MNHAKKLISGLLSVVMLLVMATTAFAVEDVTSSDTSESGNASITISNASKGETYEVYKLFNATVSASGSIAYTGTVPNELNNYFKADNQKNISVLPAAYNDEGEMSDGLREALKAWAAKDDVTPLKSQTSDGTELKFEKLPYGYYVVTTSQGEQAITVTSTKPNATIVDKNSTVPGGNFKKTADSTNVNIGDTVKYTVSFNTSNYDGEGTEAKKIVSYTITDTLPNFLTGVKVESITIKDGEDKAEEALTTQQFDDNNQITLKWYDEKEKKHLYKNGSIITITYTAKVADTAAIAGVGNKNDVALSWTNDDGTTGGNTDPSDNDNNYTKSSTIYTYAIALQKVDQDGKPLKGATFKLPFYVKKTAEDNIYVYAGTTPDAEKTYTNEVTTPESGLIIIKGVKATVDSDGNAIEGQKAYSIEETVAPDGYNKLTAPVEVEAVKNSETTTNVTTYLDDKGNISDTQTKTKVTVTNDDISASVKVVVNKTGAELPSTGGMGTTLFYALGGVLVTGAAILLVVKKRMERSSQ